MNGKHRFTALIGAAAVTAVLAVASQGIALVGAAPPTAGQLGCANSTAPTDIVFPTTAGHLTGAGPTPSAVVPGSLSLANPMGAVLCGVVLQDSDLTPNTVAGGSITYTVNSPAMILESNGPSHSIDCGGVGLNTCQGSVPAVGSVSPNPANTIHVGLMPGTTFPMIGAGTVITLSATYQRNGGPLLTTGPYTTNIGLTAPSYTEVLTPSPATIPAAMGSTSGSTLTAAFFHIALTTCFPVGGGYSICVPAPGVATGVPGAETGTVTFSTTRGVFQNQQQVITANCGPVPGSPPGFSMLSCLTASATLYGGGDAGTAVVTANYTGLTTGATAQAQTTVAMSATPASVALSDGCDQVLTPDSLAPGTSVSTVAGMVQPSGVVASIWSYSNGLHGWQAAYFSNSAAPLDVTSVGPHQSLLVCVTESASFPAL
jgi:hypothetical protein